MAFDWGNSCTQKYIHRMTLPTASQVSFDFKLYFCPYAPTYMIIFQVLVFWVMTSCCDLVGYTIFLHSYTTPPLRSMTAVRSCHKFGTYTSFQVDLDPEVNGKY
jgi:hypothetical protein